MRPRSLGFNCGAYFCWWSILTQFRPVDPDLNSFVWCYSHLSSRTSQNPRNDLEADLRICIYSTPYVCTHYDSLSLSYMSAFVSDMTVPRAKDKHPIVRSPLSMCGRQRGNPRMRCKGQSWSWFCRDQTMPPLITFLPLSRCIGPAER